MTRHRKPLSLASRNPAGSELAAAVNELIGRLQSLAEDNWLAAVNDPTRQAVLSRLSVLCRAASFDLRDLKPREWQPPPGFLARVRSRRG